MRKSFNPPVLGAQTEGGFLKPSARECRVQDQICCTPRKSTHPAASTHPGREHRAYRLESERQNTEHRIGWKPIGKASPRKENTSAESIRVESRRVQVRLLPARFGAQVFLLSFFFSRLLGVLVSLSSFSLPFKVVATESD